MTDLSTPLPWPHEKAGSSAGEAATAMRAQS